MKKYVTVYDLIQKLSKFPADKYVEFHMWARHEQVKEYDEEWKDDDYVRFDADEVDDTGIDWNMSKTAVIIEVDANSLCGGEKW